MDALARHRLLQMAGVPVAMRVPRQVEWRDDVDNDLDEEFEDDDLELEDEDDLDEDEDPEDEGLDDEDEPDEGPSPEQVARQRTLEILGIETRARSNPRPGRQVISAEGVKEYGLPLNSDILPGVRKLTAKAQEEFAGLTGEQRPAYFRLRQGGATHAHAYKSVTGGPVEKAAATPPAKAAKKAATKAAPRKATTPDLTGARRLSTVPEVRAVQIENRIREAYNSAPKAPGGFVDMASLREAANVPRADFDAAIRRLGRDDDWRAVPVDNRRMLTDRHRAAAVRIGEDDVNVLAFAPGGRSGPVAPLRPLPATPAKAAPAKAAPKKLTAHEVVTVPPEELVKAASDGRVSRPAAARQLRKRADIIGGMSAPSSDSPSAEGQDRFKRLQAEAARLRALADEIEAKPAKAAKAPAKAAPAKAATPDLTGEHGLSTDPAVRAVQIENRIRQAYTEVAAMSPGSSGRRWVNLADIREHQLVRDLPRDEVDRALVRFVRDVPRRERQGIFIESEMNQSALTARDRAAAVRIGGEPNHFLRIDRNDMTPLPAPAKAPAKKATIGAATPAKKTAPRKTVAATASAADEQDDLSDEFKARLAESRRRVEAAIAATVTAEQFRAMSRDERLAKLREVAAAADYNTYDLSGGRGWARHVLDGLTVNELREMVDQLADISNWGTSEKRDRRTLAQAIQNLTGLNPEGYVDTATGRTSFKERQAADGLPRPTNSFDDLDRAEQGQWREAYQREVANGYPDQAARRAAFGEINARRSKGRYDAALRAGHSEQQSSEFMNSGYPTIEAWRQATGATAPAKKATPPSPYAKALAAGLSEDDAKAYAAWVENNPGKSLAAWEASRRKAEQGKRLRDMTRLSDEALAAAREQAPEVGYSTNSQVIEEALARFNAADLLRIADAFNITLPSSARTAEQRRGTIAFNAAQANRRHRGGI